MRQLRMSWVRWIAFVGAGWRRRRRLCLAWWMADHGAAAVFKSGLVYGVVGGRELLLDVLGSEAGLSGPKPLVVYVHGGGWHEGDRGAAMHPWLNPLLVSHGYVTASVTYRLSGEAPWPAPLEDVRSALRWLREEATDLGADPERVGLWGHSAGAHLAALAALTAPPSERVQAVAVSACPSDLRAERLDTGNEVARLMGSHADPSMLIAASPVCQVRPGAPPFLLAHGTEDRVVPTENSERLRDALVAVGAETTWVPVEGGGHEWADQPATRGRGEAVGTFGSVALAFFDRHLALSL